MDEAPAGRVERVAMHALGASGLVVHGVALKVLRKYRDTKLANQLGHLRLVRPEPGCTQIEVSCVQRVRQESAANAITRFQDHNVDAV